MEREAILREIKAKRFSRIHDNNWDCAHCGSQSVIIFDDDRTALLPVFNQCLIVCLAQKNSSCTEHQYEAGYCDNEGPGVLKAFTYLAHNHPIDNPNLTSTNKEDIMSDTSNKMNLKDILTHVGGDATQSIKEGAVVGTSAEARQIVIDLFWKVIPNDLFPIWVCETNLFKRAEPIVASLTVMFMATFFAGQIPYAEKIYNVANKALVADGIEIVRPMISKMREAVQEMVEKGLVEKIDQTTD